MNFFGQLWTLYMCIRHEKRFFFLLLTNLVKIWTFLNFDRTDEINRRNAIFFQGNVIISHLFFFRGNLNNLYRHLAFSQCPKNLWFINATFDDLNTFSMTQRHQRVSMQKKLHSWKFLAKNLCMLKEILLPNFL